jgi:hypothetical protein
VVCKVLNEHIISPDTFVIIFYRCTLEDFKTKKKKNWGGLDRMNSIMSCRRIPVLDSYALQQTNKHEIRIKKRRTQSLGLFFLGIERWLKVKKTKNIRLTRIACEGEDIEKGITKQLETTTSIYLLSPRLGLFGEFHFLFFFPLDLLMTITGILAFFLVKSCVFWKDFWMKAVGARFLCSVAKSTSASRIEISAGG